MHQYDTYIYEIYRERSISRAAQKLYIAQPSLSAVLKKVEREKGFQIFDRSTIPLELTQCGRLYIESLEQIMNIERTANAAIYDILNLHTGTLNIGGTSLFISFVLPEIFSKYNRRCPEVKVNMIEASTSELVRLLDSGEIDVMMDNNVMDDDIYESVPICHEELVLAVPRSAACNKELRQYACDSQDIRTGRKKRKSDAARILGTMADEPFLLLRPGNDTRFRADRICRDAGFEPRVILELEQQLTAYNLSRSGIGASFVGDLLVKGEADEERLWFYRLGGTSALRQVYLHRRKNRYMSVALKAFLDIAGGAGCC